MARHFSGGVLAYIKRIRELNQAAELWHKRQIGAAGSLPGGTCTLLVLVRDLEYSLDINKSDYSSDYRTGIRSLKIIVFLRHISSAVC